MKAVSETKSWKNGRDLKTGPDYIFGYLVCYFGYYTYIRKMQNRESFFVINDTSSFSGD